EAAAVAQPHARFRTEAAHAPAARVLERAQGAAIEEVARPAGQALLDGGRRLRYHQVQQIQARARRLEPRRLAGGEQDACSFLRRVGLASIARTPVAAAGMTYSRWYSSPASTPSARPASIVRR